MTRALPYLVHIAFGDLTFVEHGNASGDGAHEEHIVLDDHDGALADDSTWPGCAHGSAANAIDSEGAFKLHRQGTVRE